MKNVAINALLNAESLINNWQWLPGSQIKVLTVHLVKALDAIASYAINETTVLESVYLTLSSVRLFEDSQIESCFYDTYFFLKNLLRKDIQRIDHNNVKIVSSKQELIVGRDYFQDLIDNVKIIVDEVFQ